MIDERRQVPYSMEVLEILARHRQLTGPNMKHRVPETSEEIAGSLRLEEKLRALIQDPDLVNHTRTFLSLAQTMMGEGEITEEQYLSLYQELHS